ncbi:VOC family protein [Ancylobacter sp. 6x-1]|uniref:VOC family protein n=1 Tax=Ancylobacter crimeensis TaxID=2579147 RepID=A0ABT0DEH6_9HYPH|nr:VOC family protein [Ancylobacter crimeensis]MCK0198375.1 VOC family protein [Ancylobacter crimeensis]
MTTLAPAARHTHPKLPDGLTLGAVRLRVRDGARSLAFYRDIVGLTPQADRGDGLIRLGAGDRTLIELEVAPDAAPRPRGTTGLFHVAILVPDRASLAVVLRRLVEKRVQLGASDHLVSEALYLDDPDGNGIEIYRDRPRDEWTWQDGEVAMATEGLDGRGVMSALPAGAGDAPMPAGTVIGHVHLQVGDLAAARRFYVDTLGMAVTTQSYPGALFVSAGDYHHHLGLNIWQSRGRGPAPEGATGLVHHTVKLPAAADVEAVAERLKAAGAPVSAIEGGIASADPWGTRIHVIAG